MNLHQEYEVFLRSDFKRRALGDQNRKDLTQLNFDQSTSSISLFPLNYKLVQGITLIMSGAKIVGETVIGQTIIIRQHSNSHM